MPGRNKRKKGYANINIAAVVTCSAVILVIAAVLVFTLVLGKSSAAESSAEESSQALPQSETGESSEPASEEPSEPQTSFTEVSVETAAYRRGDLIVVNRDHAYAEAPETQTVNVALSKTTKYKVAYMNIYVASGIMDSMNRMLDALYESAGSNALTVADGFRTFEKQNELYTAKRNENGREPAAGYSDMNTGLSFTAWVYPSTEGYISKGKFAWLDENCRDYGFILRYPTNKISLTGIDSSSDSYITYRYVGLPHSYLISLNDYCLEEYIEFVARFRAENMYIFDYSGTEYGIYYVPVSDGDTTIIPVPEGYEYTVSGDNIGGFIVTVHK